MTISGTELRRRLRQDLEIPPWFSFPEVLEVLRERYPALSKQGFTLFFTGLSGSGKSTIANAVMTKLMEAGGRRVTMLDGDIVRKHLSSELGFSFEHRNLNIERIGFVASEITKNGGVAICAPIAPYAVSRRFDLCGTRRMGRGQRLDIDLSGQKMCKSRFLSSRLDRQPYDEWLVAPHQAVKRLLEFTGVSDPYEAPENPEMRIDTTAMSIDQAAQQVLLKLENLGYLK